MVKGVVMRLTGVCASWVQHLADWQWCAPEGGGLTASRVTTYLLLPSLRRHWPQLPRPTDALLPDEELWVKSLLDDRADELAQRLTALRCLIDQAMMTTRAASAGVTPDEIAVKLLTTIEAFETLGETISDLELRAVVSTYLTNLANRRSRNAGWEPLNPPPQRGWCVLPVSPERDVTVTRSCSGHISIGPTVEQSSGAVAIDLVGAQLSVDVANPDALPICRVTDLPAATATVRTIYGDRLAVIVNDVAAATTDLTLAGTIPNPDALTALINLACLRWCRETSPVSLDDDLLEAQELCLVGRLKGVLSDADAWEAKLSNVCGKLIGRPECLRDEAVDSVLIESMMLINAADSPGA